MSYYVYTLAYPAKMGGKVFYVGKGSKSRVKNHMAEARKGVQSVKCDIIRQIWARDGQVVERKVAWFDTEKEAYEHEKSLIISLGIENLANLATGQGGKRVGAGRKARPHIYRQTSVDVREDLAILLDVLPGNWRENIEEALIDFKAKKWSKEVEFAVLIRQCLEKFMSSPDFRAGVILSTKESYGGHSCGVELLPDGKWLVQRMDRWGNKYESTGKVLLLPALDAEDMADYIESDAGSEDDFLSEQFDLEERELKEEMYKALS
jgi:hypothetical protein